MNFYGKESAKIDFFKVDFVEKTFYNPQICQIIFTKIRGKQ